MANPRRLSTGGSYTAIGAMNSQINILQASDQRDARGEFLPLQVFIGPVWARIQFLADKYTEKPQQVVTEATHKIILHYVPGLTSAMLVQDLSVTPAKIYNVTAVVDPDNHQVELWLMCYERDEGQPGVAA